jgi:hypothetical protein
MFCPPISHEQTNARPPWPSLTGGKCPVLLAHLAVLYGGRQDARLEPKYIQILAHQLHKLLSTPLVPLQVHTPITAQYTSCLHWFQTHRYTCPRSVDPTTCACVITASTVTASHPNNTVYSTQYPDVPSMYVSRRTAGSTAWAGIACPAVAHHVSPLSYEDYHIFKLSLARMPQNEPAHSFMRMTRQDTHKHMNSVIHCQSLRTSRKPKIWLDMVFKRGRIPTGQLSLCSTKLISVP